MKISMGKHFEVPKAAVLEAIWYKRDQIHDAAWLAGIPGRKVPASALIRNAGPTGFWLVMAHLMRCTSVGKELASHLHASMVGHTEELLQEIKADLFPGDDSRDITEKEIERLVTGADPLTLNSLVCLLHLTRAQHYLQVPNHMGYKAAAQAAKALALCWGSNELAYRMYASPVICNPEHKYVIHTLEIVA